MNIYEYQGYFDIEALSDDDWPVECNILAPNAAAYDAISYWPDAARRRSTGRGATPEAALASGLGSAFELASACRWPDLKTVRAAGEDLPGPSWDPVELSGFSTGQIEDPGRANTEMLGVDEITAAASGALEWIAARQPNGQEVWVPADLVYLGTQGSCGVAPADTNGCAAGETAEIARTVALFELIERDATGRWWYGKRPRQAMSAIHLDDAGGEVLDRCVAAGLNPVLADITTDLCVPCVAAIGTNAEGHVAMGFAASATFAQAALSALTEMAQMMLVVRHGHAGAALRPGLKTWLDQVTTGTAPICGISQEQGTLPDLDTSIGTRLTDAGVRLAAVDLTRPEFGVPVWRVLSPDLCHWKPRFGRQRLLQPDPFDLGPVSASPNDIILRL